jgi:hypothetical protein
MCYSHIRSSPSRIFVDAMAWTRPWRHILSTEWCTFPFLLYVKIFLNEHLPQRCIGRGGPTEWPPRAPLGVFFSPYVSGVCLYLTDASKSQTQSELEVYVTLLMFTCSTVCETRLIIFLMCVNWPVAIIFRTYKLQQKLWTLFSMS